MSHSAIQTVLLVVGTVTAHASLPLSGGVNFSWSNSTGGNFNADANWTGPPGYPDDGGDTAIFNLLAGYTVQFNSNITNNNAEVNSGTVTWDLVDEGGSEPETFDYTLDATSGLALHVGSAPGSLFQALLIVDGAFFPQPIFSNSTVTTSRPVQIGRDANSSGTLNLAGGAWEGAGSLDVGVNGDGALIVSGGMTSSTGVLVLTRARRERQQFTADGICRRPLPSADPAAERLRSKMETWRMGVTSLSRKAWGRPAR